MSGRSRGFEAPNEAIFLRLSFVRTLVNSYVFSIPRNLNYRAFTVQCSSVSVKNLEYVSTSRMFWELMKVNSGVSTLMEDDMNLGDYSSIQRVSGCI